VASRNFIFGNDRQPRGFFFRFKLKTDLFRCLAGFLVEVLMIGFYGAVQEEAYFFSVMN
jgi:hypothetical protein